MNGKLGKDTEGKGCGLLLDTSPAFMLKDREESQTENFPGDRE
jgi:hypothetical protein